MVDRRNKIVVSFFIFCDKIDESLRKAFTIPYIFQTRKDIRNNTYSTDVYIDNQKMLQIRLSLVIHPSKVSLISATSFKRETIIPYSIFGNITIIARKNFSSLHPDILSKPKKLNKKFTGDDEKTQKMISSWLSETLLEEGFIR